MPLFDWLLKRQKRISDMSRQELRRQELTLQKERDRMLRRVEKLARQKQTVFDRGTGEKTPEVRRALAQEFELKTSEQLMVSRQLNVRGKELLTVSRLRMVRENMERAKQHGDRLGMITEADVAKMERLIENDAVTMEMYQERLDGILGVAAGIDEGAAGLSQAGNEVMDIWDKMDTGTIRDGEEGFEEADRRVRERQRVGEGEGGNV